MDLQCVGPFASYGEAEEGLMSLPLASDCACKYIQELGSLDLAAFNAAYEIGVSYA